MPDWEYERTPKRGAKGREDGKRENPEQKVPILCICLQVRPSCPALPSFLEERVKYMLEGKLVLTLLF